MGREVLCTQRSVQPGEVVNRADRWFSRGRPTRIGPLAFLRLIPVAFRNDGKQFWTRMPRGALKYRKISNLIPIAIVPLNRILHFGHKFRLTDDRTFTNGAGNLLNDIIDLIAVLKNSLFVNVPTVKQYLFDNARKSFCVLLRVYGCKLDIREFANNDGLDPDLFVGPKLGETCSN